MSKNKISIAAVAIVMVLAVSVGHAQSPPCPEPDIGVEAECRPAPPWTSHRHVLVMPGGCRAIVDWCMQWVCRGHQGLSRSRLSIGHVLFLDSTCDRTWPVRFANLDQILGDVVQAMVEQGILLSDGPPRDCDDRDNDDHLFEVMTTRCHKTYEWGGFLWEGGAATGDSVYRMRDGRWTGIAFCTASQSCLRRWKFCRLPDGTLHRTLVRSYPADMWGRQLPPGSPIHCGNEFHEDPFYINGDYTDFFGNNRVAVSLNVKTYHQYGCISGCD